MNRQSLIFGAAMAALAVLVCVESASLVIWTPIGPGPGFFTAILGSILAVLGIGVMWEAGGSARAPRWRKHAAKPTGESSELTSPIPLGIAAWWRIPGTRKLVLVIAALVPIPFIIEPVGFRVTIFLLLVYLLLYVERRRIVSGLAIALIVSAGSFYLFSNLLAVPLPVNALGL